MVVFYINNTQKCLKLKCSFSISTNFLEYYGYVGAVPKRWKNLISEYWRLHDIKNDIIDRLKSDKKNHANIFINCI